MILCFEFLILLLMKVFTFKSSAFVINIVNNKFILLITVIRKIYFKFIYKNCYLLYLIITNNIANQITLALLQL